MQSYLKEFFREFDYDRADADYFLSAYDSICASDEARAGFYTALSAYDGDMECDFGELLRAASTAGGAVGLHPYTAELLLCFCLSRRLRAYYAERGIADGVYATTILDLRYKLEECKRVKGVRGSFVASWFSGHFALRLFGLGRLQFEWVDFKRDYQKDGRRLTPDSRVLNVHIPGSGAPLTEEACEDAYARAYDFFCRKDGLPCAFVCHSWLLFREHENMLSEASNIRRFMEDYTLVQTGEYDDYSQLWRLFDCQYTGNVDDLPADSSLRRAYIDLIRRGEKTGFGLGIYLYQKVLDEQREA